jgi:hypothetical protein
MIQKLRHRIASFPARWTPRYNNAFSTLRDRWRLINEIRKIVAVNFFLDCSKQRGFLHRGLPGGVQRKGAPVYRQ